MSRYFFLHVSSARSWPVPDPVAWCLDHAADPLLQRAHERLVTLGPDDADRIVRLVTRRCGLVQIGLASPASVVVQHWGLPAPDIREFMKEKGLARHQIQAAMLNTKNGAVVIRPGSDFLYGGAVSDDFPWNKYEKKHGRRHVEEANDAEPAPWSISNFTWPGVKEGFVPWAVLKSAWRNEQVACPNCENAVLVLVAFGWWKGPLSWRPGKAERVCLKCRRRFEQAVEEPLLWLAAVIDSPLRPPGLGQWRRFAIDWNGPKPVLVQAAWAVESDGQACGTASRVQR